VMIVTGKSLAEKTPVISDAQKLMEKEGWVVTVHQGVRYTSQTALPYQSAGRFKADRVASVLPRSLAQIGEHAPIKGIRDAVEIVKDKKINLLVAIGGGSPIDAAKVRSALLPLCSRPPSLVAYSISP
jgi:alcohol dehydrogenase class IV